MSVVPAADGEVHMPAAQRTGPATRAAPAAIRRTRLPVGRSSVDVGVGWGMTTCAVMVVILFVRWCLTSRTLPAAGVVPDPS